LNLPKITAMRAYGMNSAYALAYAKPFFRKPETTPAKARSFYLNAARTLSDG
jgi:hypothetical protein